MSDNMHVENQQVVTQLREVSEKLDASLKAGKAVGDLTEKQEKLLTRIDELEAKNKEVVLNETKKQKEIQELKEAVEQFEKKQLRVGNGVAEEAKNVDVASKLFDTDVKTIGGIPQFTTITSEEVKEAFLSAMMAKDINAFHKKGAEYSDKLASTAIGQKFLRTDAMAEGGFLCPPEYYNEILKKITETSDIRSIAKVRPTIGYALRLPVRNMLVSGAWENEAAEAPQSNSLYGMEEIPANRLTVQIIANQMLLMNAAFDMQAEIMSDVTERFAQLEGRAFVLGTADTQQLQTVRQPIGFMADTRVGTWNSGIANSFDFDGVIQLTGQVKAGYKPMFVFNRRTRALMMTMKSSIGQYLWTAGNVAAGQPNMIAGFPYLEAIDMPDVDTNTYPIAFGDFTKGYLICDRMLMNVVRDDFTLSGKGEVRFVFHRYVGGKTVLPEAIKKLKCSSAANSNPQV